MLNKTKHIKLIALSWAISISIGALGAHFLKQNLSPESLNSFLVGNRYHFYINISLILVLLLDGIYKLSNIKYILSLQYWSLLLFSGSIYALSTISLHGIVQIKKIGFITPIGGVLFILSWLLIVFKKEKSKIK